MPEPASLVLFGTALLRVSSRRGCAMERFLLRKKPGRWRPRT
ncbi:MAG: PEP-CTERM sorting domain-containing protein [Alphaproteobacteria bacterium]|nr:PEP-CTERM sorting domain-containing protein [Alphaproteobacteria bacterium]MBV9586036.1 PEP-CTERM sorting domain-containing protein [Alphaproteobacteria bacterium]